MQNRLNHDWWLELEFDRFYLMNLSFDSLKQLDALYEHISEKLNHIMDRLYYFCDTVQFTWYYKYWKIKKFDEMENMLKKEIEKFDLKRYINLSIELPYNKIKEGLLKRCEQYLCEYFSDQDLIECKLRLGIV